MNTPQNAEHRTPENSVQTRPGGAAAPVPENSPAPPGAGEQEQGNGHTSAGPGAQPAASSGTPAPTQQPSTLGNPAPAPAVADRDQTGNKLAISSSLGHFLEPLSEPEQADYFACEEVVASGWNTFVQVGLALARIRDGRLYRMDFETFEQYCRLKWEYGRNYVDRLISAAQVFTHLLTNSHQKPDHETQVRPLVGLTQDQAQQAWDRAVQKAGGRRITARTVKSAVQELGFAPEAKPAASEPRQTRAQRRRLIDEAIGQLLVLLSQKASHEILTQKVEALHRHIRALFPTATKG
jgi:hypothetical protein